MPKTLLFYLYFFYNLYFLLRFTNYIVYPTLPLMLWLTHDFAHIASLIDISKTVKGNVLTQKGIAAGFAITFSRQCATDILSVWYNRAHHYALIISNECLLVVDCTYKISVLSRQPSHIASQGQQCKTKQGVVLSV